jgi:hypothetical protein
VKTRLSRFFDFLSEKAEAPEPWSRKTHTAYPEIVSQPDGTFRVRFYMYEGAGIIVKEIPGVGTQAEAEKTVTRELRKYKRR